MNSNIILLKALIEPDNLRIKFWQAQQKHSDYSEIEFWKELNNSLDFYFNKIYNEIERKNKMKLKSRKKPQNPNIDLSLHAETNGEATLELSIDNSILIGLRNNLLEWANDIKPFIYYYNYKRQNIPIQNYSLLKHYDFLKNLNIISFGNELKNKPAEQITEFLDFHLRNFKRQYEKFSNWNELLAEWFRHTKKQIPATFTPHQKDRFLTWLESQNKSTPKKSNKISSPTKALFCKIVSELEIIKKHETEANGTYCKKVCNSFGFEYVDRVRQNFNNALTQNAKKQIEKLLLPLLEAETRNKIKDYLNKPKQK